MDARIRPRFNRMLNLQLMSFSIVQNTGQRGLVSIFQR